ncbi:MAG: enoyl-CoA hydratase/isomerase family protein [Spirochaetes bacterium]|jgi:enoyl-CoA hydratase/carnithine racemase|nr:enoyl-CoA hydratase/isomerase family protein [Spirochaetota bacterium]
MSGDTHTIQSTREGHIGVITLSRADKLNALTSSMIEALERALGELSDDDSVRAVIMESSSDRAFSAGADIGEWGGLEPLDMWRQWIPRGNRVFSKLAALRQPTIAVISGIAYGGGLELALACDFRVATESARFAMPEVTIGTVPGWRGLGRLSDVVGTARAKEMVLTGKSVDATTAASWGLVNSVVRDRTTAVHSARDLARDIAANAPIAVQTAKSLLNTGAAGGEATDAVVGAMTAFTQDAREGTNSFREKRPPRFTGT